MHLIKYSFILCKNTLAVLESLFCLVGTSSPTFPLCSIAHEGKQGRRT